MLQEVSPHCHTLIIQICQNVLQKTQSTLYMSLLTHLPYYFEMTVWIITSLIRSWSKVHTAKVKVLVARLYLTLCDPMDSPVHEIFQARILEWVSSALLQGNLPDPGIKSRSLPLQAVFTIRTLPFGWPRTVPYRDCPLQKNLALCSLMVCPSCSSLPRRFFSCDRP